MRDPVIFVEALDGVEVGWDVFDLSNENLFFDNHFERDGLAFLDAPFDALLVVVVDQAGCGQGRLPSRVAAPLFMRSENVIL